MKNAKWITQVIVPIVTAAMGIVGGNYYGESQGEEKVIKSINQETNVNVNLDNYLDVVNKLSAKNADLKRENEQLREDNDNTAQETEASSSEGSSLLEVSKAMNACGGYEEVRDDTMSLRGENYSNGFILRYYQRDEGVEFKLNKKYDTLSFDLGHLDESDKEGKFTLIIFADGKQEKVITQNPEDPVTHYDVSINKADIIKIEWSPEKYADFGMANVKVK